MLNVLVDQIPTSNRILYSNIMATDEEAIAKRVTSVLETQLERDKVSYS